jgi:hypothetical protein
MSASAYEVVLPDIDHLRTEVDAPLRDLPSEKQQRLLTKPLYSSWDGPRPFLAAANVGIFPSVHAHPLVPDVFISLGVEAPKDWWAKRHRTYFAWEFGKVYDPQHLLQDVSVQVFIRVGAKLVPSDELRLAEVGLGLTLWRGAFEDREDEWLRWCDASGAIIPTGAERAEVERQRAEAERQRADEAERRVAALQARLRALGVEE